MSPDCIKVDSILTEQIRSLKIRQDLGEVYRFSAALFAN
jgi:hypothetical protein